MTEIPSTWVNAIDDIAHALSQLCRYTGHSTAFYSVAQHSYLVSLHVPREFALWGLLHDAAEAYIGDMSRPLKGMLPKFKEVEDKIMAAVCLRFNLSPAPDMPPQVKKIDNAMLATEMRQFMLDPPAPWVLPEEPLNISICPMFPDYIEGLFFARFQELCR